MAKLNYIPLLGARNEVGGEFVLACDEGWQIEADQLSILNANFSGDD